MSLEGRVALVTGGSRGIGAAICESLAADGADVAVNYRRDRDAAERVVAAVEARGRRAVAVAGAVGDRESEQALVDTALAELGHVDILVNNAGIASRGRAVIDTDPDELERVLQVHALGAHRMCRLLLGQMRELDRGDIVFISSVATLHHRAFGAPYNMGKAAMEALAFTLAKEERPHGIRVNVVAPGLVETEMGRRLVKATQSVDDIRTLDDVSPFGRVCRPEDIANVVRFLVSDEAFYVSGEKVNVWAGGQDER
jgi:NAD(P)-dependent dehydrogenase (short-subunit alcohol dehydrogenase family)